MSIDYINTDSFPNRMIIEQVTKRDHVARDCASIMIYEKIDDMFVCIERFIDGEWNYERSIGGGTWINGDPNVFDIIIHGVRTDW
jgi:hypothetical protein